MPPQAAARPRPVPRPCRPLLAAPLLWGGLAAAITLALAFLLWSQLRAEQAHRLLSRAATHLELARTAVEHGIQVRAGMLQSVAMRMASVPPADAATWFRADADLLVAHVPGMSAMGWVDQDLMLRAAVVRPALELPIGKSAALDPARREAFARAARTGRVVMSAPTRLQLGDRGVLLVAQVPRDDGAGGYLISGVEFGPLLDEVLRQAAPGYLLRVTVAGEVVAERGDWRATAAATLAVGSLELLGQSWQLSIGLPGDALAGWRNRLPEAVLAVVLLAGVLILLGAALAASSRRHARSALEARRYSEAILESIRDGFIGVDRQSRITYMNRAAGVLMRCDPAAAIGRPAVDLFPEVRGSMFSRATLEVMERGEARTLEAYYPPLAAWIEARLYPGSDGAFGYFRDVSERRRRQQVEAIERESLRLMSAGAPLSAVLDGIVQGVEALEPGAAALLTLAADEAEAAPMRAHAAAGFPVPFLALIAASAAGPTGGSVEDGARRCGELAVTDIAGDMRWPAWRALALEHGMRACWAVPVELPGGRVAGTLTLYFRSVRAASAEALALLGRIALLAGLALDRDRSQRALRASEERFRLAARAAADALWDLDLITGRLWWGCGFERLFGVSTDGTLGYEDWAGRLHPEDRDPVEGELRRVLEQGGSTLAQQYRFRRADGSYAIVQDRSHVLRDAEGRAVRMVGGLTDLSERIALEERLAHAQRLDALGQLTGGVAHDFNNLLTVIQGNADLLAERVAGDAVAAELTAMVAGAARSGAELTRRLLAIARRQSLDPAPLDVNLLLARLPVLLSRTLGKHIEITLDLAEGLDAAMVDEAQLETALINLCLNARDAMPHGGRLRLATRARQIAPGGEASASGLPPGAYVAVSVEDTGHGIAAEHLPRLFEPFFTTRERSRGTGLGLAMVYGFARQSGGGVEVASEVGQGTRVTLHLPCAGVPARPRVETAEQAPRGCGETVLVVEDEAMVREVTRKVLESLGYRVRLAADAAAALNALVAHADIDLVLSDVQMPGGMNGFELARAIRSRHEALPIVLLSGYAHDARVSTGAPPPDVRVLAKPYPVVELAQQLRAAIGRAVRLTGPAPTGGAAAAAKPAAPERKT
jgi:PAS domain S-box-containing protein